MRKFRKVYIEITEACNCACPYCPCSRPGTQGRYMSRELFTTILSRIKDHAETILFHVKGEPLIHPDCGFFLDLSGQHGFRVHLVTNGKLLGQLGDLILAKEALYQVSISLHSAVLNGSSADIDTYCSTVISFIKKSAAARPLLHIMLRLWNIDPDTGLDKDRLILQRLLNDLEYPHHVELDTISFKALEIANNVYLSRARPFTWPDFKALETRENGFCYGLRDQIGILVDGTVVPCCLDWNGIITLGNLKDQRLEAIVSGKRAKALYDGFSQRKAVEPLCRHCDFRTRFD